MPYHLIIPVESHLCVFQEGLECRTFSLIGFRSCNVCVSLPFSIQLIWVNPVPYCCDEWITGIGDRQLLNLFQLVLVSGQPDLSSYTNSHHSQTMYCQGTDDFLRDFCYKECGLLLLLL